MATLLSGAQAAPQLCWFEPAFGHTWSARSAQQRTQVSARGMHFSTGLDLRFAAVADRNASAGETFSLTRLGWGRSGRHTVRARQEVRFNSIYPGIDVRYRFTEGRLEYDLLLAPGARLDRVRIQSNEPGAFPGDGRVRFERSGISKRAPVARYASGGQEAVAVQYARCGEDICFAAAYDRSRAVVIDPVVEYATYFGSSGSDLVRASATDGQGNLYVAGDTSSPDFPVTDRVPGDPQPDVSTWGSFIAKFSPSGQLVYVTHYTLAGIAYQIAVDAAGALYVVSSGGYPMPVRHSAWIRKLTPYSLLKFNAAGNDITYRTFLPELPTAMLPDAHGNVYLAGFHPGGSVGATAGAFRATGPPVSTMLVKLSTTGRSGLVAATYFEGLTDNISNMAWDSQGNLVVAGWSGSSATRSSGAVQPLNAGVAAYRSMDGGASWSPEAPMFEPNQIFQDPTNPARLWGLGNNAFWSSTDFGRTWQQRSDFSAYNTLYQTLVTVPSKPDLLFLPGFTPLKSTDGGLTWTAMKTDAYFGIGVDAKNTDTVVAFGVRGVFVSQDGGQSWTQDFVGRPYNLVYGVGFFPDPSNPGRMLVYDQNYGLLAFDFTTLNISVIRPAYMRLSWIEPDPAVPGRLLMIGAPGSATPVPILASMDGGATTTQIGALPGVVFNFASAPPFVVDPIQPNTFYLTFINPMQKTTDGGQTWSVVSGVPLSVRTPELAINPLRHTEVLLVKGIGTDAVVASFSADLSRLRFSTYFGGNGDEQLGGLALGQDDSITIVGTTWSTDLAQRYGSASDVLKGANDVFVARLSADGKSKLAFRLVGGSSVEYPSGAALDSAGNLVFGGNTFSLDYPVTPNSPFSKKPPLNDYSQFLTVLGPDLSLRFSTYLGGNGMDTFQGPNVLPDGRVWLTGTTTSTDLPVSGTAISGAPLGLEDAYVMLLDWRR